MMDDRIKIPGNLEGGSQISERSDSFQNRCGWLGLEGRVIFGLNSCLQDKGRGLSIFMRTGLGPGALDSRFYHVGRIRWTPSYREERGKNRKEG